MAIAFQNTEYLTSAPTLAECPTDEGVEVAFAGRSNAGKSSAINALTKNRKMARTSKTPGRTQMINFFTLGESQRLVDLPGYGYAKVPLETKKHWQEHLFLYLQHRQSLQGLILLMDVRHPLQEEDSMLLNWAIEVEMPTHILLTKADKLKFGPAKNVLIKMEQHLYNSGVDDLVSVQLFSSLKSSGMEALTSKLNDWLNPEQELDAE